MANDSLLPYDNELKSIFEKRGDIVVDSYEKLVNVVNIAFNEPNKKATAYFGILNKSLLDKIQNDIPNLPQNLKGNLFKPNSNYSIAATLDSIRHLVDDKSGMTQNDVVNYLDKFADTLIEYDFVHYDVYYDSMRKRNNGILFKKEFDNGTYQSFNIISNKKKSLSLVTLYMNKFDYKKKKSAETLHLQNTDAHTPKAGVSQTSIDNVPQKDTTVNSNDMQDKTRYSLKEHPYSYKTLTSKPDMKIIEIDDKKDYAPNKPTREDVVNNALVSALSVGHKDRSGNIFVYVDDIDTNVMVSKRGLRHSLDRRLSIIAPVTENIGAILKNSIRINELTPEFDTIEKSYALIGIAKNNNNEPYVVSFIVNKASNEIISVDVLYAVNAKKEATALIEPELSSQSDVSLTASTISISDLLDYVNKYYPDILPEDVLKHYGYKSRPEGVLGESALYSRKEQAINYNALLEENKELSAANKDLQRMLKLTANQNEKLKNEFKITNRHNISNNALDKVAVQLRRQYSSKYSKSALVSRLSALYDYIANAGSDIEMGYIWNNAYDIALNIIDNSQHKDTSVYDEYKELRDYIRTTSICVPESVQNFKMQG